MTEQLEEIWRDSWNMVQVQLEEDRDGSIVCHLSLHNEQTVLHNFEIQHAQFANFWPKLILTDA